METDHLTPDTGSYGRDSSRYYHPEIWGGAAKGGRIGAKGGGIAKRGTGAAYKKGGRVKSMGIAKRGGGVAKR